MAQYQQKRDPVIVDAYKIGDATPPSKWFTEAIEDGRICLWPSRGHCVSVRNRDGENGELDVGGNVQYAYHGDFVFMRTDQHIHVSRPDTFNSVYEPVEELCTNAKLAVELDSAEHALNAIRYYLREPLSPPMTFDTSYPRPKNTTRHLTRRCRNCRQRGRQILWR